MIHTKCYAMEDFFLNQRLLYLCLYYICAINLRLRFGSQVKLLPRNFG